MPIAIVKWVEYQPSIRCGGVRSTVGCGCLQSLCAASLLASKAPCCCLGRPQSQPNVHVSKLPSDSGSKLHALPRCTRPPGNLRLAISASLRFHGARRHTERSVYIQPINNCNWYNKHAHHVRAHQCMVVYRAPLLTKARAGSRDPALAPPPGCGPVRFPRPAAAFPWPDRRAVRRSAPQAASVHRTRSR